MINTPDQIKGPRLYSGVPIGFKTGRVLAEFEGDLIHEPLVRVAIDLARWSLKECGVVLVVTGALRFPEEQARYYPDEPNKPSPHLIDTELGKFRALDIRSSNYTPTQQKSMTHYANQYHARGDGYKTLLFHSIGRGMHGHVQVAR